MSKLKSNIQELRKIIAEESFNLEEANEFLDAVEEDAERLQDELSTAEKELDSAEKKIDVLEDEVTELEEAELGETIECGIGKIQWEADNLQLELIMEALAERIKSQGALSVLRKLQMSLPTT